MRTLALNPTAYAHVAKEEGEPGIAVQYWYNYYYNDFANKHEGDWEMVQVMFDEADSAEEALQQEPTRTAFSGHAGGELAGLDGQEAGKGWAFARWYTLRQARTPRTTRRARSSASQSAGRCSAATRRRGHTGRLTRRS